MSCALAFVTPIAKPEPVVPLAARILSGHSTGYTQTEHATATLIRRYLARGECRTRRRM
jgi:hypothetical protein